ncbi:MAG: hypothetical protein JRH20_07850 [Deltaproteobacteria bacterium]|nr:hypothetical protein [Deltaproteobacteria bacterium]
MRRLWIVIPLATMLLVALPSRADAKLFEVWAAGIAGGAFGDGDATSERDFYNWAKGGAGGIEIGAKVLFISGYIDYLRFFGGDATANLFSFNLGGDYSFGLTDSLSVVFRLVGSFYLGTLDDAARTDSSTGEVQTRGIGTRGGVGLRYSFAKVFSVGITPLVGYHYFFGGADQDITDTEQNSSGYDFQAMGYFRVGLGF